MSEPKRIGMLITELELGGAEQRFCDIACGLDRSKLDVRVCSLGPRPAPPKDALAIRLEENGIDVTYLNQRSVWQLPGAIRQVRAWFQQHECEAAQSFLFHANVVASWAAPKSVKLSLGLRVADPRRWRSWLERQAGRRADRIICVSPQVRTFAELAGYPSDKLRVIQNGVAELDTAPLDRESLEASDEHPLIVFVGRLDRQKGVDWLIANADEWLRDAPDTQIRLLGEGPLRGPLEDEIRRLGRQQQIRLLGWRADAVSAIAAADLLILPSRWEGMPNVVMEAMALGKPVLCAEAEGVNELLGENKKTQTARFGDVLDWAAKTRDLTSQVELRRTLGDLNRERISRHFSLRRMIAEFEGVFSELLKNP